MKSTKPCKILILFFLFFLSSCSFHVANYSILSNHEIHIKRTDGIKVTGKAKTFLSTQQKLIKKATQNALNQAGPEYDILTDVTINAKIGLFQSSLMVTGTAHKSKNLINN